ncbi:hypothetical protein H17ap60334_04797 [Thermosipho africanus H17ap60334]|uniref:hypothetical protein n=1 Tax=Thermosipho africanus TaxID=2421 RepID=UPI00028E9E84|nr:hypothetical protein [Thermosipho africanus]EKF49501.1 hypothetical protein H17ap60334_04797 [Thermosipho africanus H17ap60334]
MKSSYKLLIFISVLIFSLSLFGELTISSEELKSILSYSENIYYSRSQFVFGKTGQYLSKLIVENDVEQKVTEGFFGLSSDFYLAIKEGWNKFDLTHNVKEAVFIYLPYYESVTNAFRLTDSNSINWIYFYI